MRIRSLAAAAVALFALAPPAAAQVADPAAAFGARATVRGIQLSPEATAVLYLTPVGDNRTAAVVADLATGAPRRIMNDVGSKAELYWCAWKSEQRIVCMVGGQDKGLGLLVGFSRVVALDRTGRNFTILGQTDAAQAEYGVQNGGQIIDLLPDDPDHVLMTLALTTGQAQGRTNFGVNRQGSRNGLGVYRVNVQTGTRTSVESPKINVYYYQSDSRGRARMMSTIERNTDTGMMGSKLTYLVRGIDGGPWRKVGAGDVQAGIDFNPEGFDASDEWLLALKPLDGRQALYRIATDGSERSQLLFKHDRVDVAEVLRIGKYARPVAAVYVTERTHHHYLDPAIEKLSRQLGAALPGKPEVSVLDESWDGAKKLFYAGSDVDPGRYYIFDQTTKRVQPIIEARPALAAAKLAPVRPVSYPAADGTQIPAYLTLPPGRESAKGLPAIVMPHGGPSSRDVWGFDWLVQFYAARGYAVLQPQYRGSAGYGDAWFVKNGFKSWAIAIGDINAGARWMIAQGIANPARLAIVGWSYGGYAALQANVVEPSLYRAAVAIAPVSDLALLKEDSRDFADFNIVSAYIGSGPHISAGSPLQNAAAIRAPVLMFHGDRDLNVDIRHARRMDEALKRAGRASELIVYPGLQHSLIDDRARADLLTRSAAFLDRATGG